MRKMLRILFNEDEENVLLINEQLKRQGYNVYYKIATDTDSLKINLQKEIWDVVLSKYSLININTLEVLYVIKKHCKYLPFILICEDIDSGKLVELVKNGCNNLVKLNDALKLGNIIEKEMEEGKCRKYKDIILENNLRDEQEKANNLKEFYLNIYNEAPAFFYILNKDNTIDYANKTFLEFVGEDNIQKISNDYKKFIFFEHINKFNEEFINSINKKTTFQTELRLLNKQVEYRWVLIYGKPLYYNQGNYSGFLFLGFDIERIKQFEERLIISKHQAEEENKTKSAFLANMSHEIRTPLNGIDGMIDLTLRTELTAEQKENLNIAKECSNSLIEVINNILDFSKIEAGKIEIKKSEFKIEDLIEKTVKSNLVHARNKGIELKYKILQGTDKTLIGDYKKIQQVLNNLISNAIKFTNIGRVTVAAEIISEEKNSALFKFSVSDTGIGIAPEDMDKLFKSFSQVDSSFTRKYGGTGLGLIISKKLVELMGGNILVNSIYETGSTFYFNIKIEYVNNEKLNDKIINKNLYKEIWSIPRKILIVEDNEANQIVIKKMCIKLNHSVKVANNGREAVEILDNESFDLVLMDIQMPVMNGIEATQYIRNKERQSGRHIPIAALTAYAFKEDRDKFINIGMDEYLAKPVMIEDLYKCIEKLTSKNIKSEFHNAEYYLNIDERDINLDKKTYLHKVNIEINKLKGHIESGDFVNCEKTIHKIKEYSPGVKSVIMKNASFRAELASRRKDINGIKKQLLMIEEEYNRIIKSIHNR